MSVINPVKLPQLYSTLGGEHQNGAPPQMKGTPIMKIKVIEKSYDEVMSIERSKHVKPIRPNIFFRSLLKLVSLPDLIATHFTHEKIDMERLGKREPALYLMNHSSFIDLEIVASMLYPRPFNIVTTNDGFIGKEWLMRHIGCIPTSKFVSDTTLVRDIVYTVRKLESSIVLFPEAGYSFDGTSTTLPKNTTGALAKMLGIPVIMIHAYGAFIRDPLYNNLQRRHVRVSATEKYLLSAEDVKNMTVEEIEAVIDREFSLDNFAWQRDNKIKISESFRADYLNRVLYKCPHCLSEGNMHGEKTSLTCHTCGQSYEMDEYGSLSAEGGKFTHIPDWYAWQREAVREEIERGEYSLDIPVDICMTVDHKAIYSVGGGRLTHNEEGFVLTSDDGKLRYEQRTRSCYTLNSDFNWYELGDVISIGNHDHLFYCFPRTERDVVAKARLATEELYKIFSERHAKKKATT